MTSRTAAGRGTLHSHLWIMGVAGIAIGVGILVVLPKLKVVSASLLLFAGFHLVGAIVILASAWSVGLRSLVRRLNAPADGTRVEFGWGPGWMNGLAIAALIVGAGAVALQLSVPALWPLAWAAVALAVVLLTGNLIMNGFRRRDQVVLSGNRDVVLDAGCGAGRTTIALSRILKDGHVVAVDRFDAGYIDDGGRALLEHNLALTGLSDRVTIETADLTQLPFNEADFDSAVSTHVYDHLGKDKQRGLDEVHRVLKPGGRFLMAVWVPGWAMFAVANLLSLFLTSKSAWREMAARAGFRLIDEGMFNNAWFVLLEKPATPSATAV